MIRLLLLGTSFPPGVQALYPDRNPAGHAFETQMVRALRPLCDLRSTGLLPVAPPVVTAPDPASGVAHELVIVEGAANLLRRWRALGALKQQYLQWHAEGWRPDVVLCYNLPPVYSAFVRWLGRRTDAPCRSLLLLDSAQLGRPLKPLRRLRYHFKPLVVPDVEMLPEFEAAIGLSQSTERFFSPRGVPFLWVPGGCTPERMPLGATTALGPGADGPIRFGYFGALAAHAGTSPLLEAFEKLPGDATLHVCGYGKLSRLVADAAKANPRVHWHGLLPTPDDCLRLAQHWDVLINPRPPSHGNENNFPSKLFDYALCSRAILTTRMSGADTVLGPAAFYFDPVAFPADLAVQLARVSGVPRSELLRRGVVLRERVVTEYSWPRQAARMIEFLGRVARVG